MASIVLIVVYVISTLLITLATFAHLLAPNLPQYFKDLLLYGKVQGDRKANSFVQKYLEVPKRWFTHFYALGALVNVTMLVVVFRYYQRGERPSPYLAAITSSLVSSYKANIDAAGVILLIGMMAFQNVRRLYECLYVSVYSKGMMNIGHFALGVFLYSTFSIAALSEGPRLGYYRMGSLSEEFVKPRYVLGLMLFVWSSWHHNKVHHQLANLRKDDKGAVTGTAHGIPHGGWFEHVSCPHYLAEMLIYAAFFVVAGWRAWTVTAVVLFVWDNQLCASYLTHSWYREHFKDKYPANRTAVIPGVF